MMVNHPLTAVRFIFTSSCYFIQYLPKKLNKTNPVNFVSPSLEVEIKEKALHWLQILPCTMSELRVFHVTTSFPLFPQPCEERLLTPVMQHSQPVSHNMSLELFASTFLTQCFCPRRRVINPFTSISSAPRLVPTQSIRFLGSNARLPHLTNRIKRFLFASSHSSWTSPTITPFKEISQHSQTSVPPCEWIWSRVKVTSRRFSPFLFLISQFFLTGPRNSILQIEIMPWARTQLAHRRSSVLCLAHRHLSKAELWWFKFSPNLNLTCNFPSGKRPRHLNIFIFSIRLLPLDSSDFCFSFLSPCVTPLLAQELVCS